MPTTSFHLDNLSCQACVKLCTLKFRKLPGVSDVRIDLPAGRGEIDADKPVPTSDLVAALSGTHYTVRALGESAEA